MSDEVLFDRGDIFSVIQAHTDALKKKVTLHQSTRGVRIPPAHSKYLFCSQREVSGQPSMPGGSEKWLESRNSRMCGRVAERIGDSRVLSATTTKLSRS